mmetsp:Transcript_26066/g.55344  ORF Transcript_26066/g.55344 Transcript_26066/m.55344 type:complete len:127 (+) Transcript_26066:99-479(+)
MNNESIEDVVNEATDTKNDNNGKSSNVETETITFENSGGINSADDGGNGNALETSSIQNHETSALSENILYSTFATEAASIDYDNMENSHITVVIKLGSYPQVIGWSLLSFDGSINMAKPPGLTIQ